MGKVFISPNFHVVLVHVPLGVFLLGLLIELFSFLYRRSTLRSAGRWMVLLGALSTIPAAYSGIYALDDVAYRSQVSGKLPATQPWAQVAAGARLHGPPAAGRLHQARPSASLRPSHPEETADAWQMFRHHAWRQGSAALVVALTAVMALGASDHLRRRVYFLFMALLLGGAALMVSGAWYGGEAVYREGAATRLQRPWPAPPPPSRPATIPAPASPAPPASPPAPAPSSPAAPPTAPSVAPPPVAPAPTTAPAPRTEPSTRPAGPPMTSVPPFRLSPTLPPPPATAPTTETAPPTTGPASGPASNPSSAPAPELHEPPADKPDDTPTGSPPAATEPATAPAHPAGAPLANLPLQSTAHLPANPSFAAPATAADAPAPPQPDRPTRAPPASAPSEAHAVSGPRATPATLPPAPTTAPTPATPDVPPGVFAPLGPPVPQTAPTTGPTTAPAPRPAPPPPAPSTPPIPPQAAAPLPAPAPTTRPTHQVKEPGENTEDVQDELKPGSIAYYVGPPLQIHVVLAGLVTALSLGALGASMRRLSLLRENPTCANPESSSEPAADTSAEASAETEAEAGERAREVEAALASTYAPGRRPTTGRDIDLVRTIRPGLTVAGIDAPPERTPAATLWLFAFVAALLTASAGVYFLAAPASLLGEGTGSQARILWLAVTDPGQNHGGFLTRRLAHVIVGGTILLLPLALAALSRWNRSRLLLTLLSLLLAAAVTAQIWLGVLLLYDTNVGRVTHFSKHDKVPPHLVTLSSSAGFTTTGTSDFTHSAGGGGTL